MDIIIPMYNRFITQNVDSSWHAILKACLAKMNQDYLKQLVDDPMWLPGIDNIFNAFSLPFSKIHYILFGESPYPRQQSANGYAFWDAAVGSLWSETGLSKPVNRATSLRNIIKMLLITAGELSPKDTSQSAIKVINKSHYINTLDELFYNLHNHGFLMLNATPVWRPGKVQEDGRYWLPFMEELLLQVQNHKIMLVLLGKIAQTINKLSIAQKFNQIYAEHPYNLSFINNSAMIKFFKPLKLLDKAKKCK